MKKLLSMIGAMTLIGTASTSVVACGCGKEPTPIPIEAEFQKVSGWTDTNGEVYSLVNNDGTIYAGTQSAVNVGKLYKINSADVVSEVSGWDSTNGAVMSLLKVNDTVYAGTKTATDKGNLYKSK